jgi:hypothetical protein
MSRHPDFVPQGVIPAVLLPFHEDLSIDERSFRIHLRDVRAVQGLSAITINAHSTEVASCTEDEQRRVMEIAGERSWCFRRRRLRLDNRPRWRSRISRAFRMRPICR